jgi:hypothetical protein
MTPTNDPDPSPQAVLSLDYDGSADPWRPAVRLVAIAVVAQGVTMAAPAAWVGWFLVQLGTAAASRASVGYLPVLAIERLRGAIGIALAVAAAGVLRGQSIGRSWLLRLEPVTLALSVCQVVVNLWQTYQRFGGRAGAPWVHMATQQLVYSGSVSVLPTLAWAFFRRPETRPVSDSYR